MRKCSKHTTETKEKMKGRIPWNKGTAKMISFVCKTCGKIKEVPAWQTSKFLFCSIKCRGSGNTGRTWFKKGQRIGIQTEFKKGHIMTKEVRRKIGKASTRENHWNWQGGKSFEIYPITFNNRIKKQIRERDNHTCQECNYTEKQLGYKLHIHHIDYDKQNCNLNNLISLCRSCHTKTNYKRNDWIEYYKQKLGTA